MSVTCFNCGGALSWQGERCAKCDWRTRTCIVTVEDILEGLPDDALQRRGQTEPLARAVYRRRISAQQEGLDQ